MSNQDDSSRSETQQIRAQVQAVVDRAKSDPEYKQQLKSSPQETLRAAGVPDVAIGYLSAELTEGSEIAGQAEVSGYMMANQDCDRITCIITCCSTYTGGWGWSV